MQSQGDKVQTLPSRFSELKRSIFPQDDESKACLTAAWKDLLEELQVAVEDIKSNGSNIIPQVDFSELQNLKNEDIKLIKRRGVVLVKNVIDDEQASTWRETLKEYVKINAVEGFPAENKQFFELFWTKPQVQARAHPNVIQLQIWLNNLYHSNKSDSNIDLSMPLVYADRFRIRQPGVQGCLPPHIDGGGIERWEDDNFRSCFSEILKGNWKHHDPYDLTGRVQTRISLYKYPGQASVFRAFQGWLALSETAPTEGTLKVFLDVVLSNAYVILRPFFKLKDKPMTNNPLDSGNWEIDTTTPDFPGIAPRGGGFDNLRLSPESHPHLRLEETMTSIPTVKPGDMIFWHCDVIHSVEQEHTGKNDTAVIYIPAVPRTPHNLKYLERQKETFLNGLTPPDFPKTAAGEGSFIGVAKEKDIVGDVARKAMGFAY